MNTTAMKAGVGRHWGLASGARWCAGPLAFAAALALAVGCDSSSSECDGVGCAQVPTCPGVCASPCGCCGCGLGTRKCGPDGGLYECTGSCFQLVKTCSTPDACIHVPDGLGGTAICAESSADCGAVKRAYEQAVASLRLRRDRIVEPGMGPLAAGTYELYDTICRQPSGCEVQLGHCEEGLGGPCWYLAESGEPLDSYAAHYRRLGCATPTTCDCPSPDIDVSCEDDEKSRARCVVR